MTPKRFKNRRSPNRNKSSTPNKHKDPLKKTLTPYPDPPPNNTRFDYLKKNKSNQIYNNFANYNDLHPIGSSPKNSRKLSTKSSQKKSPKRKPRPQAQPHDATAPTVSSSLKRTATQKIQSFNLNHSPESIPPDKIKSPQHPYHQHTTYQHNLYLSPQAQDSNPPSPPSKHPQNTPKRSRRSNHPRDTTITPLSTESIQKSESGPSKSKSSLPKKPITLDMIRKIPAEDLFNSLVH